MHYYEPGMSLFSMFKQEAQLPQRDRTMRYVSKFVLFYEVRDSQSELTGLFWDWWPPGTSSAFS